jgi:hypothetical protein
MPFGVASLVIEFGGDEEQAIAGLLHDVIEDGGPERRRVGYGFPSGRIYLEQSESLKSRIRFHCAQRAVAIRNKCGDANRDADSVKSRKHFTRTAARIVLHKLK